MSIPGSTDKGTSLNSSARDTQKNGSVDGQSEANTNTKSFVNTPKHSELPRINPIDSFNIQVADASKNTKSSADTAIIYTTAFINTDQQLYETFKKISSDSNDKATICYIGDKEHLSTNNLTDKNTIIHNIDNTTTLKREPGILFSDNKEPVTILLDFNHIDMHDFSSFNSLFDDNPPTLYGKPLGTNIKIVSLVGHKLFNMPNGPGNDFWRRVFKTTEDIEPPKSTEQDTEGYQDIQTKFAPEVEVANNDANSLVIELAGKDWHNELFGHLDIDANSNIFYAPGKLSQLQPNQYVYLKDAPWQDIEFNIIIQELNAKAGYVANNQFQKIPQDVKFHSCKTHKDEIKQLQDEFKWGLTDNQDDLSAPGKIKIFNEFLFYSCMQEATIKDGKLAKHDTMKQLLGDDTVAIRVTTKLSQYQWFALLTKLKAISKTGIRILQDNPISQPEGWKCKDEFNEKSQTNKNIQIILNNRGFIPEISKITSTASFIDIQVSPETTLNQLLFKFKGVSMETNLFDITETLFLEALQKGWDINLYGLEYNPKLMHELEALFSDPPYLVVQGVMKTFANARLKYHLPNHSKMVTGLWQQARDEATEVSRDNLNISKAKIHEKYAENIDKNLSNQMIDRVAELVEDINAIAKNPTSPKANLIADTPLFNKIWAQALAEQKDDSCTEVTEYYFAKAFNSIVSKRYREDSETYYLTRLLTNSKINPEQPLYQDQIGLANFLGEQQEITLGFVEQHACLLSKFIPYAPLLFKQDTNKTNSTVSGLKRLISVALSLLKFVFVTAPFFIVKAIGVLIYNCFVLLSKIIPLMETRDYMSLLEKKSFKSNSYLKRKIFHDKNVMQFIKASIVASIDDKDKQAETKKNLGITDAELVAQQQKLAQYESNYYQIEKFFRDICYTVDIDTIDEASKKKIHEFGYQKFCHDLSVGLTEKILAVKQSKAANQEQTKNDLLAEINKTLATILPGNANEINQEISEIAQDLFNSAIDGTEQKIWKFWLERRYKREESKLKSHPLLIIKGSPGTGKSVIAREISQRVNPNEKPVFFNVRSGLTTVEVASKFDLDYSKAQKELILIKGPLLQWADQIGDAVHTLILDEATLTDNLWDCLKGMHDKPPYIMIDGEKIDITANHKIIMTSNSDYYPGRKPNHQLEALAAQQTYLQFAKSFTEDQIIKKDLMDLVNAIKISDDLSIKNEIVNNVTKCITELYGQYKRLIPNYIFTARDLTECYSRIEAYLSDYITGENNNELTTEMIYAVTREAMKQTMANGIPIKYSGRIKAIDIWHTTRFPGDNKVVNENNKKFEDFYDTMQTYVLQDASSYYKKFDFENASTKKLVKIVWRELQRIQLEQKTGKIHKGRHAIVIESPAGMGKDSVISLVAKFWESQGNQPLNHDVITAGIKSTDKIISHIKQKHTEGGLISISEINTYDTQSIEGYLNNYLADLPATIGYSVICTINPVENNNLRNEFSPALKSRFTQNVLQGHSFKDLHSICQSQLNTKKHADLIAKYHWQLVTHIQNAGKTAYPSIADIQNLASFINKLEDKIIFIDEDTLEGLIKDNYNKYTRLLQWDNETIDRFFKVSSISTDNSATIKYYIEDLTIWINQQSHANFFNAITIAPGIITHFNYKTGVFSLSDIDQQKNNKDKQQLILKQINSAHLESDKKELSGNSEMEGILLEKEKQDARFRAETNAALKRKLGWASYATKKMMKATVNKVTQSIRDLTDCAKNFLTATPRQLKTTSDAQNKILDKEGITVLAGLVSIPILPLITGVGKESATEGVYELEPIPGISFNCETIDLNTRKSFINQIKQELNADDAPNKLKIALAEAECSDDDFNKFLSLIENKEIEKKLKTDDNRKLIIKGFEVITKLNSSAADTLMCLSITLFNSLDGFEVLAKTLTKGNINYDKAISIIKNSNPVGLLYTLKSLIIENACKNLLEKKVAGDQVDNLIKILEYLIKESDGNHFDINIMGDLILLSQQEGDLEYVADKAKELLDYECRLLAINELKFPEAKPKKTTDILATLPAEVQDAISKSTRESVINLIMQAKKEILEYSWNPGIGISATRFLENKEPFEHAKSAHDLSPNITLVGTPITNSLKLCGLLYHKPTGKIINLLDIMLDATEDNFKLEFDFRGITVSSKKTIKAYLAKKGIIFSDERSSENPSNMEKLSWIISEIASLLRGLNIYTDLTSIEDTMSFEEYRNTKTTERMEEDIKYFFTKYEKYKEFEKVIKELLVGTDFSYIPRDAVLQSSAIQILENTNELTFCCDFNNSSTAGTLTVKNEAELSDFIDNIRNSITNTPFLDQQQFGYYGNTTTDELVKEFQKQRLKDLLTGATAIHMEDIIQENQNTINNS